MFDFCKHSRFTTFLNLGSDFGIAFSSKNTKIHELVKIRLYVFKEMGKIYFDVMKDDMFLQPNEKYDTYDSDVDEPDPDLFYRIINMKMPKIPNPKEVSR